MTLVLCGGQKVLTRSDGTCPRCGGNHAAELEAGGDQELVRLSEAPRSSEVDPKLVGIRGWLVLPAVGFVLGLISGVYNLIVALVLFSDVERAGNGGIYALALVFDVGLLVFLSYAATRFFLKEANAPTVIITFFLAHLGTSVVLLVTVLGVGPEEFAREAGRSAIRAIVTAAIWIPYFRVSKRVRATFVNR